MFGALVCIANVILALLIAMHLVLGLMIPVAIIFLVLFVGPAGGIGIVLGYKIRARRINRWLGAASIVTSIVALTLNVLFLLFPLVVPKP